MENGIATIVLGSSTPHHGNTASSSFVSTPVLARSSHRLDDDFPPFFFLSRVLSLVYGTRIERKRTIEFANLSTIRTRVTYRCRFVTSRRDVEYRL